VIKHELSVPEALGLSLAPKPKTATKIRRRKEGKENINFYHSACERVPCEVL
jgi:hypothetical protein